MTLGLPNLSQSLVKDPADDYEPRRSPSAHAQPLSPRQNAARLRRLGGEPPTTDLIVWRWEAAPGRGEVDVDDRQWLTAVRRPRHPAWPDHRWPPSSPTPGMSRADRRPPCAQTDLVDRSRRIRCSCCASRTIQSAGRCRTCSTATSRIPDGVAARFQRIAPIRRRPPQRAGGRGVAPHARAADILERSLAQFGMPSIECLHWRPAAGAGGARANQALLQARRARSARRRPLLRTTKREGCRARAGHLQPGSASVRVSRSVLHAIVLTSLTVRSNRVVRELAFLSNQRRDWRSR